MVKTRYKHFKSVVICQCELKVVFLSLSLPSLSEIAQLQAIARLSWDRYYYYYCIIFYFTYMWYYENLMIHWAHSRERESSEYVEESDWNHIQWFQYESFEWRKKLFIKSFQWLNWIHFKQLRGEWENNEALCVVKNHTQTHNVERYFTCEGNFKLFLESMSLRVEKLLLWRYINFNLIAFKGWVIVEKWGN
jgi:hypothetical protein